MKADYDPEKDDALRLLSKDQKIFAVPSRSAIVYDGSICSFIGKHTYLRMAKKTVLSKLESN